MGYRTLADCVRDLEASGRLVRIDHPVDPELEIGAIQRRVYQAEGPALLFTNVKDCRFPMLGNLFGTLDRTRWIFRDTLATIEKLVALKVNPSERLRRPWELPAVLPGARTLLPKKVRRGPVLNCQTRLSELPQLKSWPQDGGAFITLPQVYSESAERPGLRHSNLGMYRVQISGGEYEPDREAGLHYQIHRGIGAHHAEAMERGEPFRVNIFVGGAPSMTVAAVMPLPEGMPELAFAGLLGGHRIPMTTPDGLLPIPAEADFCICGTVDPAQLKPEGPFGDHLGYYSLAHDFPVLKVDRVYHRPEAILPFTTVGRPPQEDTTFGAFIHELTGPLIPTVIPGVHQIHAVDAAGVHPLLLAMGSERYVPYAESRRPQELLTLGNAILGQGQLSLAKYLFIGAREDNQQLDLHDIDDFLCHMLERVDLRTDLHFQTCTTIDTLDYSGTALNEGSKVVVAAAGEKRRSLPTEVPADLTLPTGYSEPRLALPGILVIQGPPCETPRGIPDKTIEAFCASVPVEAPVNTFPMVVIVDDSEFTARTLNNFLWTTFTRSNPAVDIYGIGSFTHAKHWGCHGAMIIDARRKPHHAPPLFNDPAVERRVDELGQKGGPLHGLI